MACDPAHQAPDHPGPARCPRRGRTPRARADPSGTDPSRDGLSGAFPSRAFPADVLPPDVFPSGIGTSGVPGPGSSDAGPRLPAQGDRAEHWRACGCPLTTPCRAVDQAVSAIERFRARGDTVILVGAPAAPGAAEPPLTAPSAASWPCARLPTTPSGCCSPTPTNRRS
ncbi:hypothetical protein GXW82_04170 [Streptacidiphilus sp. 4-A2]|nr:hypothetical protein [Streptacidiphilus sp. 4-A2]